MIAAILVLAAQADPSVDKVERVAVDLVRPYSWSPLAVTISSRRGFKGDLVIKSRLGFSVVKRVDVPAGGAARELVPALDPESVELGEARATVPRPGGRAELAVAVDARLPYAGALVSSERARFSIVSRDDLARLLEGGMLDGVDLLLLSDAAGLEPGAVAAHAVALTQAEAEKAVADARPAPRAEAVDGPLWELAREGGWVPAKRANGVLFAAAYALAAFAALALAARKGAKVFRAALLVTPLAGAAAFALLFPRGQVWIEEIAIERGATERRIWFAGAATPSTTSLSFPRLAKPVFRDASGSDRPYNLRLSGRGCVAEDVTLGPGARLCFASQGAGAASPEEGRTLDVEDPLGKILARFFEKGPPRAAQEGTPLKDVDAPGLADARRRARVK